MTRTAWRWGHFTRGWAETLCEVEHRTKWTGGTKFALLSTYYVPSATADIKRHTKKLEESLEKLIHKNLGTYISCTKKEQIIKHAISKLCSKEYLLREKRNFYHKSIQKLKLQQEIL